MNIFAGVLPALCEVFTPGLFHLLIVFSYHQLGLHQPVIPCHQLCALMHVHSILRL